MTNTPKPCTMPEKKYYWSDDEEHLRAGPFDTLEQVYSEAYCHRAKCFDVPEDQSVVFIHHGFMSPNPDYEPEYPNGPDNFQYFLNGETVTKVDALTITDYFYDQWIKLSADLVEKMKG